MINLNKIFPWLSIRNKLLIAFAGLSILPLAFVGVYSIVVNVRTMREVAMHELTEDVRTIREKSENFLDDIYSDLRVLQNSSFVETWMNEKQSLVQSRTNLHLGPIATELLAFARTKGIYYQLRLVGDDGDELVRVECEDPDDSVRQYRSVPQSELRRGRESYYFLLVRDNREDQIAFAPGEVQYRDTLRIPVISFALPLMRNQHRVGILIANVFEKSFIDLIEGKKGFPLTRKVILVTGNGQYLYRSDMEKNWNQLLAARGQEDLQKDYPPQITASILSGKEGALTDGVDDILSYAPLFAGQTMIHSIGTSSSFALPIIVFETEPARIVMEPVRSYALTYVGFLALFLFSAVALGLVATRQITGPIAKLQRGAEVIAQGNYANTLNVDTHDEIETLAHQFNAMAASLGAHEQEIQRHRTQLEEMVSQRTHELEEEKAKLQAVLDNVPSAFVLLDRSFRIQTVSAAFSSVTGRMVRDGHDRETFGLIGNNGGLKESPWERAAMTGEIESCVEQLDGQAGAGRFLEYIAIPMKDSGDVHAFLVIITDITKRKKLEQQLVHAEKLMAAGEMSSIIAHEFRNALTSVKMILQLFVESERATRTDKKSLAVALDSIYHMEGIMTELLDFARPKAVQLRMADLNKIIHESIDFIRPHIRQNEIDLASSLDRHIKPRPLDESRMKEAMINLLLNAIQSFDGLGTRTSKRSIGVATRLVRLQDTMRDVVYAESVSELVGRDEGLEVVLEKGTECSLIEVRDNGIGISKDVQRRIFDPFYTTKTNGTGLGLPMVKRTVTAHRGIVTVESSQREGTIFRIYIPTADGK